MWEVVEIGALSADVYTPAGRARFILLSLADVDCITLRDNAVWTRLLEANHLACVCPDGDESWWADRVCPSFDPVKTAAKYVLEDVVPWARVRFGVSGIGVTGVGAGGQGALRLAFDRPDLFRVVTSLSGAIDHYEVYGQGTSLDEMYPSKEHCRQDGAILHVQPHDWPPYLWFSCDPNSYWFRGNDRLHEKLTALGVPHGFDQSQVCGHSWSYYDTLAGPLIGFTVDGLQKESRRLV